MILCDNLIFLLLLFTFCTQVPEVLQCKPVPSEKERVELEIIKKLISSYFDIVKKNFIDLAPKTIMHFLVLNFKNNLQNSLVSEIYKEQYMNELMKEDEENAVKRRAYTEMRDLLHRAIEIVNEVVRKCIAAALVFGFLLFSCLSCIFLQRLPCFFFFFLLDFIQRFFVCICCYF